MTADPAWDRAVLALGLVAVDPHGLGGIWLRARAGPVRDRLTKALDTLPFPLRRIHPNIADKQLFGGVDISATLDAGYIIETKGILGDPATLVLGMAERASGGLAGRIAHALDGAGDMALIALDEGADADERLPSALADRLAFHLDLGALAFGATAPVTLDRVSLAEARQRLAAVEVPESAAEALVQAAVALGISSLRAPMFALRAARAICAISDIAKVGPSELDLAAALVFAPRATRFPDAEQDTADQPPEPPTDSGRDDATGDDADPSQMGETLVEAVRAALPAGLLNLLATTATNRGPAQGSGSGQRRTGYRRGRPLPPRPGAPDGRHRIDLVSTLRAAAPWQAYRRARKPAGTADPRLIVRREDMRVRRFEEHRDRLLIFAVDASGSAAMARLAEAKGAIEMLLGEAYARRDHVALIGFRGTGAEVLLPPTRSLVQTKRRLAALPGGGGTPLAAGLQAAALLAQQARGRGLSPAIALLTDGRANIALDGAADRARAAEDAIGLAAHLRASGVPALVIDSGKRTSAALEKLARHMGASYVPLPRADSASVSTAVSAAFGP
ncbi:MAG: magnesium chelatase subunit D [Pseudomonadota bacterium]